MSMKFDIRIILIWGEGGGKFAALEYVVRHLAKIFIIF